MNIADKIRTARNQAGLSQQELADSLHVSRSAIAKWEAGNGLPDIENLKALSLQLGISMDDLTDNGIDAVQCTLREKLLPGTEPDAAVLRRWPDALRINRLSLEHDFNRIGKVLNTLSFGLPANIWQIVHDKEYRFSYYLVDAFDEHIFVQVAADSMYISPLSRRLLSSEQSGSFTFNGRTYSVLYKITK